MSDDFGSRYTQAFTVPLALNSASLNTGSLQGIIGPDDTSDEDWFKVSLLKGATYEFTLTGGTEIYDLNNGRLELYSTNGTTFIGNEEFRYFVSSQDGSIGVTLITSPISSTGDYFINVELGSSPSSNDVGAYTLEIEQLTRGFQAATPVSNTNSSNSGSPQSTSNSPSSTSSGGTIINNYFGDYINQSGNSGVINNQQNNSGSITNNQSVTISVSQILNSNNYTPSSTSIGSQKADEITGTAKNDQIEGGSGADILNGRSGSDTLMAGRGRDLITGGAGSDIIDAGQSSSKSDADKIYLHDISKSTDADLIANMGRSDKIYILDPNFEIARIDGGLGLFNSANTLIAVYTGSGISSGQLEKMVNVAQ